MMGALTFDDLLSPQQPGGPAAASQGPLSFDDLIPQQPAAPQATAAPAAPAASLAAAAGATGPVGDQRPWYAKPLGGLGGQTVDDLSRLAAGGLTFGFSDKLAGMVNPGGVAAERAATEAAKERQGWFGTGAEFAGGMAIPMGLTSRGLSLVRNIPAPVNNLLTRSLASGVEGAGLGALSATGHDEDIATGAKVGAVGGALLQPAGEALAGAVGGAAGLFNRRPPVPTGPELRAARDAAYVAADQSGVVVKPAFVDDLRTKIRDTLARGGYSPNYHTGAEPALREIESNLGQNVTLSGVERIRQIASDLRADPHKPSARLGGEMVRAIDDALENMNASHVLSGNRTQGVQAFQEARRLNVMARKTEAVENAVARASQNVGSAPNVGPDKALRDQFKSLLRSREGRFLTPDERAAVSTIIQGTSFQNAARLVGTLAPTSGVAQAAMNALAGYHSGGVTVPLSIGAAVARGIGARATQNNVYALARIIAGGGAPPKNAVQRLSQTERDTLAKILSTWGIQGGLAGGAAAALP